MPQPILAQSILHETTAFLRTFPKLIRPEEIAPLEKLGLQQNFQRDDDIRLLLAGEFKAGKSTLLNALAGGRYAASDILEMTSWVAKYCSSESPFCIEHRKDGSERTWDPNEFLRKCESREFSEDYLTNISLLEIGTGKSQLPGIFIDAPGMGSVTRANEQRLIQSLDDADILVWVLSIDTIGDANEIGFIEEAIKHGTPYIIVLTKCDLLDSTEELEDIEDFIKHDLGLEDAKIFPVAALSALGAKVTLEPTVFSLAALRKHIANEVSVRNVAIRAKASQAHHGRVRELGYRLVSSVYGHLDQLSLTTQEFQRITESIRLVVQLRLENFVLNYVRTNFFGNKRNKIQSKLAGLLQEKDGELDENLLNKIFKEELGEGLLDQFWQRLCHDSSNECTKLWAERLDESQQELAKISSKLANTPIKTLGHLLTHDALAKAVKTDTLEAAGAAFAGTVGMAGVVTAYTAWLGPAAASISVSAAATGVGLPILGIGAVVALGYGMLKNEIAKSSTHQRAGILLDNYLEEYIDNLVRPQLFPKLNQLNQNVAASVVENFGKAAAEFLPPEIHLSEWLTTARVLLGKLT
jgi:GTP-binding protein EngB required for normal cell division